MINYNQYCLIQHSDSSNIQSNSGSHAISCITDATGMLLDHRQSVSYTDFNKASYISRSNLDYFIIYGPDRLRRKTQLNSGIGDDVLLTKYYAFGDYEKEITPSGTRHLHYISGGDGLAAIYVKYSNAPDSLYFITTDHLGSIVGAINSSTGTIYRQNFDAWGRKRNPQTWSYTNIPDFPFDRGYTGHEHLKWFGLINMNGRMYDAALCRFLSPDPYVQMPDYTQNFNRYSYALNNPLIYSDPSGEWIHLVIGAVLGGTINWIANGAEFNAKGLGYFGVGALAGALAAGVGAGVSSALISHSVMSGTASFSSGFVGTATATGTGFFSSAVSGAAGGITNGLIQGTGNSLLDGNNIGDALFSSKGGIDLAWRQGATAFVMGGLLGGIDANINNQDFWTGAKYDEVTLVGRQNGGHFGYTPSKEVIGTEEVPFDFNSSIDISKLSDAKQVADEHGFYTTTINKPRYFKVLSVSHSNNANFRIFEHDFSKFHSFSIKTLGRPDFIKVNVLKARGYPITNLKSLFNWRPLNY